ncbi:MAG TPA: STAS domain-containing protein [Longimicrobium sp.]|nr:STAS domain-containing protein [Longimicrobium sp.]
MKTIEKTKRGAEAEDVLPLPELLDTPAVVLAGLLAGHGRPVVLDASAVREVQATALPLLETLLRETRDAGLPARIVGAPPALRRRLEGHPLAAYLGAGAPDEDALFVCPDRDDLGFQPSYR